MIMQMVMIMIMMIMIVIMIVIMMIMIMIMMMVQSGLSVAEAITSFRQLAGGPLTPGSAKAS